MITDFEIRKPQTLLLGGSCVVINGVISSLIGVMTIVTLIITVLITSSKCVQPRTCSAQLSLSHLTTSAGHAQQGWAVLSFASLRVYDFLSLNISG